MDEGTPAPSHAHEAVRSREPSKHRIRNHTPGIEAHLLCRDNAVGGACGSGVSESRYVLHRLSRHCRWGLRWFRYLRYHSARCHSEVQRSVATRTDLACYRQEATAATHSTPAPTARANEAVRGASLFQSYAASGSPTRRCALASFRRLYPRATWSEATTVWAFRTSLRGSYAASRSGCRNLFPPNGGRERSSRRSVRSRPVAHVKHGPA